MENRRVVISRLGGPEVLREDICSVPDPSPGQVRIKIIATGVAFADVLMRYGLYPRVPELPFAPGYDIVGTIDALGEGVAGCRAGETVAALVVTGGYSQYITLPAADLIRVPGGLDPAEAVALVLNYTTAYQMLHRKADVVPGSRILVHGAAGGVGTALLELGRLAGLEMYGTASRSKHESLRKLGCTPIDYKTDDFVEVVRRAVPRGLDAVFDPVGGRNWWRSYRTLNKSGKLVAYGLSAALSGQKTRKMLAAASFAMLGLLAALPGKRSAGWYNVTSEKQKHPGWFREDLAALLNLLAAKKISPVIATRLPLREAQRAHQLLESASVAGKIVLMCGQ